MLTWHFLMPNNFFYLFILMAMSAFSVPTVHSVCHVCIFRLWCNDRDKNETRRWK